MEIAEFWFRWRYYRVDTQPFKDGWSLWFYTTQYDGWHYALHCGPIVFGWGDGIPPSARNATPHNQEGD